MSETFRRAHAHGARGFVEIYNCNEFEDGALEKGSKAPSMLGA